MKIDACLSHNHDNWRTPKVIYDKFMSWNYIDCFKFKSQEDELENNYKNKRLFINPPFSKMKKITEWVIKQINNKNLIALLIPARTDTDYFHKLIKYHPTIFFIKGRLHYNESGAAPFPTILLIFNATKWQLPVYAAMTKELDYIL